MDMDAAVGEISQSLGFGQSTEELPVDDGAGFEEVSNEPELPSTPSDEPPVPTEAPVPAPAPVSSPRPDTWRAEALAEWDKLSPTVQQEILKREQDISKGLETYRTEANFAKEFRSVLAPYMEQIQASGVPATHLVANILNAQNTLVNGTLEQKAALLHRLAQNAGLSFENLVAPEAPHIDPEVKALQAKMDRIESTQQAEMNARLSAQRAELSRQVEAFFADPKNVYANEVADDMVALIRASGGQANLAEIYEKAVYANPVTRAKEIQRLAAETKAKEMEERKKHAEAARRASSANVKTRAKETSGAAGLGSMDDTMRETLAKIQARNS